MNGALRIIRASGVSPGNGTGGAVELAAGIGGVLLGAILGDLLAQRAVRDTPLETEPPGADPIVHRLVRLENNSQLRVIEERRSAYILVGSLIGGILAPFAVNRLVTNPARATAKRRRS